MRCEVQTWRLIWGLQHSYPWTAAKLPVNSLSFVELLALQSYLYNTVTATMQLQVCGRRFARSDERRRHTKIHLKDRTRVGSDKKVVAKQLPATRLPNTGTEKTQPPIAACVPQYQPGYHNTFQSNVMANTAPQIHANMQKMYGLLPSNTGMLPINGDTLPSNVYNKQDHQDPLYLYNQHMPHPQELGLIWIKAVMWKPEL